MNQSKNSNKSSFDEKLNEIRIEDENNITFAKNMIFNSYNSNNNINNFSVKECREKYDLENLSLIEKNSNSTEYKKIYNKIIEANKITPICEQNKYKEMLCKIIDSIKISNTKEEFPKLPYGKSLTDDEFIQILGKCVSYANSNLKEENLNQIKYRLQNDKAIILENMFKYPQILKDLYENALITILTSKDGLEQNDNFELLTRKNLTMTPLIKMNFNDNSKYSELDKRELIDIFISDVYLEKYNITLEQFIPNYKNYIKKKEDLIEHIKYYFENFDIFFCEMPKNIMALTIHTGNMYLKSDYLMEY